MRIFLNVILSVLAFLVPAGTLGCAKEVMADYYPQAVWCNEGTFTSGGWQACFRAAGLPVRP
jgi:hypothetical protein